MKNYLCLIGSLLLISSTSFASDKSPNCQTEALKYASRDLQLNDLKIELVQMFNAESVSSEVYEITNPGSPKESRYFVNAIFTIDESFAVGECQIKSFSVNR